jgi:hypothetical protein
LPKLSGIIVTLAQDHVSIFMDAIDAYNVNQYEDAIHKLFAKFLEVDVGLWFKHLPSKSIKN